jgi:hypothetical protein
MAHPDACRPAGRGPSPLEPGAARTITWRRRRSASIRLTSDGCCSTPPPDIAARSADRSAQSAAETAARLSPHLPSDFEGAPRRRVAPRLAGAADRDELAGRVPPAQPRAGSGVPGWRPVRPRCHGSRRGGLRHRDPRSAAAGPTTRLCSLTCPVRPRSADGQRERRGGRPWAGRTSRGSAPSAERLDQSLDSSLACVHSLGGLDVVDVLASESEGEPVEGGTGYRGCVQGDFQVGRLVHFARSVSSSSVISTSSPSTMPAAARLAALMPTRYRPPFEATRLRQVWRLMVIATAGRFPSSSASTTSGGCLGARCVPGGDDRGTKGLGVHRPRP